MAANVLVQQLKDAEPFAETVTLAEPERTLPPPSPMPARKLRYEQIKELTYDELMNCLTYKNEAVAHNKMAELSDCHGKPIDQFD